MAKTEIRMTGSGGQGVIMGTIILAEAAFEDGKKVAQCQAYGPEARGGSSKAECIISDDPIAYTKVIVPDLLLSLTQLSLEKYSNQTEDKTVFIVDSELEVPQFVAETKTVYSIPILSSATDVIQNPMSANIISCGAINEVLHVASQEALEAAVLNHVPKGTEEKNLAALHLGAELIRNYKK